MSELQSFFQRITYPITNVTIVSRIISKPLNGSMRNVLSGPMCFIVPICGPSSTAIRTVGFYVTVSPGSDVGSAVMNIFWPFLASVVTSASPVTKSDWSSLANGCVGRS